MTLTEMIERNEGRRHKLYLDTRGNMTIGVGRNLSEGLSDGEIDLLLQHDIRRAKSAVRETLGRHGTPAPLASSPRFAALVDMAFTLGAAGFADFAHMLEAIRRGNWAGAAAEVRDSLWHREATARAERAAHMLETDEWPPE